MNNTGDFGACRTRPDDFSTANWNKTPPTSKKPFFTGVSRFLVISRITHNDDTRSAFEDIQPIRSFLPDAFTFDRAAKSNIGKKVIIAGEKNTI